MSEDSAKAPKLKPHLWVMLVWLASLVVVAVIYPGLPDQVPSHWNLQGEVDDYSHKAYLVGGMLLLSAAIYFGMGVGSRIDPSRRNYVQFKRAFEWLRGVLTIFPLGMLAITIAEAQGLSPDVPRLVGGSVSLIIMVVGNRMGQLRHNYFIGIRTPWTLASEVVWQKTHRFAAWLWSAAGLIGFVMTAILDTPWSFHVFIGGIAAAAFISFVYSYIVYRRLGS